MSLNSTNNTEYPTNVTQLPPLEALDEVPQLILMILYSMTSIVSFFSNSIVIFVLVFGKKSSPELKKFLINLAVSDICMAILSIPFTYTDFMLGRWIFPAFLCPFAQFIAICAPSVSVHTLTAIGFERYFAIKYPLRRSSCFVRHGNKIILLIWIFGGLISLPQLFASKLVLFTYGQHDYYDCRDEWIDKNNEKLFLLAIFVMTFALPILFLSFTYGSIGIVLKKHITPGNADNDRDKTVINIKIKAVKMMSAVVVMFVLCWLPIQVFNLFVYNKWYLQIIDFKTFTKIYIPIFFGCHFLAMAHSMINPFIYCFMSDNFILDLKELICDLLRSHCLNSNQNQMNYSNPRLTILSENRDRSQLSQSNATTRV